MAALSGPGDLFGGFDPFRTIGDVVGNAVSDGWTGIMLSFWASGLWVLRLALNAMDAFLTPDLSASGPASSVYETTLWAAASLVVLMAFAQIGVSVFRRDGKSLARVLLGGVQFVGVWAAWVAYGVAVIAACAGLTHALMETLIGIDNWAEWDPLGGFDLGDASISVVLATVLGVLGVFVWLAAIGHFVVMLTRAAALIVLAAVTPIAAAGLVSEAGRGWFWKSLRWFHAAALTPVLTVLVMGLGIKLTEGVGLEQGQSAQVAVSAAFPSVMLILVSVVAPVALFKLLAFVDPGTSSGSAMRAGMAAAGGVGGLLGGGSSGGPAAAATGGVASQANPSGQSQGEEQSADATTSRFASALATVGGAYGKGLSFVSGVGAQAAATGMDEMNQTAVGDQSYYPDYQPGPQRTNPDQVDPRRTSEDGDGDEPTRGQQTPVPRTGPAASSPTTGPGGTAGAAAAEMPPIA